MIVNSLSRLYILLAVALLFSTNAHGQGGTAGSAALYESHKVVDLPTAGVLSPKNYMLTARIAPLGNFTAEMVVAPFKNFNIGLFWSAENLIGTPPVKAELPAIQAQFRFIDETHIFPALAVGISSKTNGYFSQNFLLNQSIGAWITASKNFRGVLGTIALHGGIVASEPSISVFAGFEQSIGSAIAVVGEAVLLSKNNSKQQREFHGICNVGLRWSALRGTTLELIVHDLFGSVIDPGMSRAFGIEFVKAW